MKYHICFEKPQRISLVAVILMTTLIGFCNKGTPSAENLRYVTAASGLVMRSEPSRKGERMQSIPFGRSVEVLDENGPTETIEGKSSSWLKVRYAKKEGWVFGAFLNKTAPQTLEQKIPGTWKGKWTCKDNTSHLTFDAAKTFTGWLYTGAQVAGCSGMEISGTWQANGDRVCLSVKSRQRACFRLEDGKLNAADAGFKENFNSESMTNLVRE